MTPTAGDLILVQVRAERGPFSDESLVTFDSLNGTISGFINSDQVELRGKKAFIRARVVSVAKDAITVRLHGSFFTTTGLARIDKDTPYLPIAA
jgi:hypothetical protein